MKKIALLLVVFASSLFTTAMAPNDHPAYLQALSELRTARWLLSQQTDQAMGKNETLAIAKIDEAISEMKKASIDDGKSVNDHPKTDAVSDHIGELKKAMVWLDKAHADIDKEGDMNFGNGLKAKVSKDIVDAREAVKGAMVQVK